MILTNWLQSLAGFRRPLSRRQRRRLASRRRRSPGSPHVSSVQRLETRTLLAAPNPLPLSSLDGTTGFRLDGAAADDFAGITVSIAGDVNGDGFDDAVVGAFLADPNGASSGSTYVVFGNSSGFASALDLSLLDGTNGFRLDGVAAGDESGISVSGAGDVNADGIDDLIIGARLTDPSQNAAGSSYVVFGRSTGFTSIMDLGSLDGTTGFRLDGVADGALSGQSVSSAGDVNADGIDDLIIGAPSNNPPGTADGLAYVVYGNSGGFASAVSLSTLNGTNGFRISGGTPDDRLGFSVDSADDVNGDGIDDLIIGAWRASPNGGQSGSTYVIFGCQGGFADTFDVSTLDGTTGFRLDGVAGTDYSGAAVSGAGDVNGDGFGDVIVGAPSADPNGNGSGSSYVLFGAAGAFSSAINLSTLDGTTGYRLDGATAGDRSGRGVSAAGDVNGDGFDDLLVGADYADPSGVPAGSVYVVFGKSSPFASVVNLSSIDGSNGFRMDGVTADDQTGRQVNAGGDVDGDGFDDVIMGAWRADPNGNSSGSSYVIFGGNFTGGAETQVGGDGPQTLNATLGAGADVLIGGRGDDTLVSDGGDDVLRGGEGDDVLAIPDVTFSLRRLDGGTGTDTVRLDGTGLTLDLTAIADNRLLSIEQIDLTGGGANQLIVSPREVLRLSDSSNTLTVRGTPGDQVVVRGAGWGSQGIVNIDGTDFEQFTYGTATINVQTGIDTSFSAMSLSTLDGTTGFVVIGIDSWDFAGTSVSSGGDVNGDGFDDLIIGAPGADQAGGDSHGESYVVFGRSGGFAASIPLSSLDGTNGFVLTGIDSDDLSGSSVSGAGDVNGDGVDDLIIGAYRADQAGGYSQGETYVVFGRSGAFASSIALSSLDGTNGFLLVGIDPFDYFGSSVSGAGDVNGDGVGDLIIGANFANQAGGDSEGESYVVFGRSDGFASSIALSSLDGTNGFVLPGLDEHDRSGWSVGSAGDVNGDGFDDLIVGALLADQTGGSAQGESYVLFGRSGGFASSISPTSLDGTTGFVLTGIDAGDRSGWSVSGAGDVNGDGIDDLIIGAFLADQACGNDHGESYVVFGRSDGIPSSISLASLDGTTGFVVTGVDPEDQSGRSVSGAGDVNGDGFDDLIIGARSAEQAGGGYGHGESYVVFGRSGAFPSSIALASLNETTGFVFTGIDPGDTSGGSVSGAGDVNGDGFDDLIIGARIADQPGRANTGESYVVFGRNFTGGAETQVGGDGSDTLNAALGAGVDVLIGGRGDDTLVSDGGDDVLRGGEGDDVLAIPDTNFSPRRIQGGTGNDTLRLDGAGLTLDLTVIADNRITDVEQIDLSGSGANRLVLTRGELLRLSGASNTLTVLGDADDVVELRFEGTPWASQGIVNIDGTDYEQFTNGAATLNVQNGVSTALAVINLGTLDGASGFRVDGLVVSDDIGLQVSDAGDVNGDGLNDVVIGTWLADLNGNNSGSSFVVFGRSGAFASVIDLSTLNGSTGFRVDGASESDGAGSVSSAGDVNGDGIVDLLVGAGGADANGVAVGSGYVVFGRTSGFASVINLSTLDGNTGFRLDGVALNDGTGHPVSDAGDLNGDGFGDVLVAARGADPYGASFVLFGGEDGFGSAVELSTLDGTNGFRVNGVAFSDSFAYSVSGAGDVNGDGFDDLMIGATGADPNGKNSGSSYVIFGRPDGFASVIEASALDGTNGFRLDGTTQYDFVGTSLSDAGDVNGDGLDDIVIGARGADPNGGNSGSSFVLFGNAGGFPSFINLATLDGATGFRLDGEAQGDLSGTSVSGAGDVNGDGFDDLIIGARGANPNGDESGSTYVVFGRSGGFASAIDLSALSATSGFRLDGIGADDRSGQTVSGAGDVNGDGFDDLIIGSIVGERGDDPVPSFMGSSYVIFGGNFTGGAETQVGGDGPDTLSATLGAGVDVLIGGRGDDTLISDGGDDVLRGGEGDDVLAIPDTNFSPRRLQGGTGTDTLRLDGAGLTFDLTQIADNRITDVEIIDVRGSGANVLTLNQLELLNLSSHSNTLVVRRDADDAVNFGGGWTQQVGETIDGVPFEVFTQGAATVKVQATAATVADVVRTDVNGGEGNPNRSGIGVLVTAMNVPANVQGVTSLRVFNHTTGQPVDVSGASLVNNGTALVGWDLSSLTLPDGRYTAEIARDQVTTTLGGPFASTFAIEFHVLSGDFDGDGFVNFNDTAPLSVNFGQTGAAYRPGDGDGDGIVNFNDTAPLSVNFGTSLAPLQYDFGDAPETGTSFPTTLANDGARHVVTGNTLFLSADRDAESDGQPNASATGDGADENGLAFDPIIRGTSVAVTVTSSGSGFVNGWVDINADGDWDDPGEQVFTDQPVVAGPNGLQISVPAGASLGSTFARFRLTGSAGYSYLGLAPNGEVEDYQLTIADAAPDVPADTAEGSLDSSKRPLMSTLLDRISAIPVPTFTTFEHPSDLFSIGKPTRRGRR